MTGLTLLFLSVTQTFNLPQGLLSSLCFVESRHTVAAIHYDDGGSASLGVCQIKLDTARLMGFTGSEGTLQHNPKVNIYYAGKYLKHQLVRYHGDTNKAVAAYNAGSYRTNSKGNPLNAYYVKKVLAAWTGRN